MTEKAIFLLLPLYSGCLSITQERKPSLDTSLIINQSAQFLDYLCH